MTVIGEFMEHDVVIAENTIDEHPGSTYVGLGLEVPRWYEWDDDVKAVAIKAAVDIHRKFPLGPELDDLKQEALILIATRPETVQRRLTQEGGGLNYVGWWVFSRLKDQADAEARKNGRIVPFETWAEPHR